MLTKIPNIFKRLLKLFFPMFVAEERKTNISRAQFAKELEDSTLCLEPNIQNMTQT